MELREFDQETTLLVPDTLEMLSELELSRYYIKDWDLEYYNQGAKNKEYYFLILIHFPRNTS